MKFKIGDKVRSAMDTEVTGTIISNRIKCADSGFYVQLVRLDKSEMLWNNGETIACSVLVSTPCKLSLIRD